MGAERTSRLRPARRRDRDSKGKGGRDGGDSPTFCKRFSSHLVVPVAFPASAFGQGFERRIAREPLPRGEQRVCKRSGRLRGEPAARSAERAEEAGRKALRSAPRAEP